MERQVLLGLFGLLLQLPCFSFKPTSSPTELLYHDLIADLREKSDPDVIPITKTDNNVVNVTVGLNVIDIADVDPKKNQMDIIAWQKMEWKNPSLAWSPSNYDNITRVTLPASYLWTPDITVFNNLKKPEQTTMKAPGAVVTFDGSVFLETGMRMRVACDLKGLSSSSVTCTIKMGSWSYDNSMLTLGEPTTNTYDYSNTTSKFKIISATAKREVTHYACCSYEDVLFEITFSKERTNDWGLSFLFD